MTQGNECVLGTSELTLDELIALYERLADERANSTSKRERDRLWSSMKSVARTIGSRFSL